MIRARRSGAMALVALGAVFLSTPAHSLETAPLPVDAPPAQRGASLGEDPLLARIVTLVLDGRRLSRVTPSRLGIDLPVGSYHALPATLAVGTQALAAENGAGLVRRAEASFERVGKGAAVLRTLELALVAAQPTALYAGLVKQATTRLGRPAWEGANAISWCIEEREGWMLSIAHEPSGEVALRALKQSDDCVR